MKAPHLHHRHRHRHRHHHHHHHHLHHHTLIHHHCDPLQPRTSHALVSLLKACTASRDLRRGLDAHAEASRFDALRGDTFLGTALVGMYSRCGSFSLAREVFDAIPRRNVVTWSALMAGCIESGRGEEALARFEEMRAEGILPSAATFVCALKACGRSSDPGIIRRAREIHGELELWGFLQTNVVVGGALLDMYARIGQLREARHVFEEGICARDAASWGAMMGGYAQHGHAEEALRCFEAAMDPSRQDRCMNACMLVHALQACASIGDAARGRRMHAEIALRGLEGGDDSVVVGSATAHLYACCGSMREALHVFEKLELRDAVSWTSLIHGFVAAGEKDGEAALQCFDRMRIEGVLADIATFHCVLKACGNAGAVGRIGELELEMEKKGCLQIDACIGSSLVESYARCGSLARAQEAFDRLATRDVASWNALLAGYADHGYGDEALEHLRKMLAALGEEPGDARPDAVTFICALKACSCICAAEVGIGVHAEVERGGLVDDSAPAIANSLIDMYAKCGLVAEARNVFDRLLVARDAVSWNALMGGHLAVHEEGGESALDCYERMRSEAVCPDGIALVGFLRACGALGALRSGRRAHAAAPYLSRSPLRGDLSIGSSLAGMYANCGRMDEAEAVFGAFPSHDAPFYNVLIGGFARLGPSEKSVAYFDRMTAAARSDEGAVLPDAASFAACLRACASLRDARKGGELHASIERRGLSSEELARGVVRMYAEAGSQAEARHVFGKLQARDAGAWNALIVGLVESGGRFDGEALASVEQMQADGVSPDAVTVASALKAQNRIVGATKSSGGVSAAVAALCEDDDVVVWNTLIAGYAEAGDGAGALRRVAEMRWHHHLHGGVSPSAATYVSASKSCAAIGALGKGRELHSEVEIRGLLHRGGAGGDKVEEEATVLGNALLHMYADCGAIAEARQMLDGRRRRRRPDAAAWNSLLAGYGRLGELGSMAELLQLQLHEPDSVTFLILLTASARAGLAEQAQLCYEQLTAPGVEHRNCLLHALGRAGRLHAAALLATPTSWNPPPYDDDDPVLLRTLMGACLRCGDVELARTAFLLRSREAPPGLVKRKQSRTDIVQSIRRLRIDPS